MTIRTLIVDDEPVARRRIRRFLAEDAEVEVVGECSDGTSALEAVRHLAPELVFLDVRIPEVDGLSVLRSLPAEKRPVVVLVTAHDEYALQAFDAQALDYLLKPFDQERFRQALSRAKAQIELQRRGVQPLDDRLVAAWEQLQARPQYATNLLVRDGGRRLLVRTEEIDWIQAAGKHVRLHAGGTSHWLREPLHRLQARLDPRQFVRIHRSTIVNLDRVRELQPAFHGDFVVILRDGTQLLLSRGYRDEVQTLLGQPL